MPRLLRSRLLRLRKAPIRRDKPFKHGNNQAHRISGLLSGLAAKDVGIGDKVAVKAGGQFHRDFHGLVVGNGGEFQLRQISLRRVRARGHG